MRDTRLPSHSGGWIWVAALVALLFAFFYSATASRTVILDATDAAELQTIGAVGGIPHQPYPLWCILARSVALLPVGEPAFRVTFLSIILASLTVGLLCMLLLRRTNDVVASIAAGVAFGCSSTFWNNAVIAEVYTLNTFLIVALLYVIDGMQRSPGRRDSLVAAFIVGCLLSQYTIDAAILPAVVLFLLASRKSVFGTMPLRLRGVHAAAFLLPFTLYYYTYLIDRGPFEMNWLNHIGRYYAERDGIPPAGFHGFLDRIWFQMWPGRLRPETPSIGDLAANAGLWIKNILDSEFPLGSALLVPVGFVAMWRKDVRASIFLLLFAGSFGVLVLLNIGRELYAHSLPVYLVLAIYIATALSGIRAWRIAGRRVGPVLLVIAAAVVISAPFLRHAKVSPLSRFLRSDEHIEFVNLARGPFVELRSANDRGRTYGARVGELVVPNSIIFAGWSEANVLLYYQLVLGRLRDVRVEYLLPTREQMVALIEESRPARVYFTQHPDSYGVGWLPVSETETVMPASGIFPAQKLYVVPTGPGDVH